MAEPLNRDQVIELLNNLGSERDEEVLAAARAVHARLSGAGLSWEDLLRPEDGDEASAEADPMQEPREEEPDEEEPDEEAEEEPDEEAEADPEAEMEDGTEVSSANDAEPLALIEELLAKKGISADLRQELRDYKTDIAEGEFNRADRKYLRALYRRLSKES